MTAGSEPPGAPRPPLHLSCPKTHQRNGIQNYTHRAVAHHSVSKSEPRARPTASSIQIHALAAGPSLCRTDSAPLVHSLSLTQISVSVRPPPLALLPSLVLSDPGLGRLEALGHALLHAARVAAAAASASSPSTLLLLLRAVRRRGAASGAARGAAARQATRGAGDGRFLVRRRDARVVEVGRGARRAHRWRRRVGLGARHARKARRAQALAALAPPVAMAAGGAGIRQAVKA